MKTVKNKKDRKEKIERRKIEINRSIE